LRATTEKTKVLNQFLGTDVKTPGSSCKNRENKKGEENNGNISKLGGSTTE